MKNNDLWLEDADPPQDGWWAILCSWGDGENTLSAGQSLQGRWAANVPASRIVYRSARSFGTEEAAIEWAHEHDPDW